MTVPTARIVVEAQKRAASASALTRWGHRDAVDVHLSADYLRSLAAAQVTDAGLYARARNLAAVLAAAAHLAALSERPA